MNKKILIVDDDKDVRTLIADVLSDEGYNTFIATNEQEAISQTKTNTPDLLLLDMWINDDEQAGFKIFSKIKNINPNIPIIIISGHGNIDVAVKAMKKGAFDFIEKPFVIDRLLITCTRAVEYHQLKNENLRLKNDQLSNDIFSVGRSIFAVGINDKIEKIAQANSRVFIEGDIGLGADSIAYSIHKKSQRHNEKFSIISCIGDDKNFEKDFFGTEDNIGYIEKCNNGTIVLDSVEKLSENNQKKLLMMLQNNSYYKGKNIVSPNIRMICITNCNIETMINQGSFNAELFYRLKISNISIPSIKDRKEDILMIVNYYINNSESIFRLPSKQFSEKSLAILEAYNWPGNIYQIKNVVEYSLINASQSEKNEISDDFLPTEVKKISNEVDDILNIHNFLYLPFKEAKEIFDEIYIKAQIERFSWNVSKTADFIGIERTSLHRKLKNLNIKQQI